jgi:hypothetical protein
MTQDIERYISLAQGVAAHAQDGTLNEDTAIRFCRVILPSLLVELDLARRVDARLAQMFPAPQPPEPQPPEPEAHPQPAPVRPEPAKKRKAAKASGRAKKGRGK